MTLERHRPLAAALQSVITARRTTRVFSEAMPLKEELEAVIGAGFQAPYAIIGTESGEPIRSFIALRRGSAVRESVQELFVADAAQKARFGSLKLGQRLMQWADSVSLGVSLPLGVYEQTAILARQAATGRGHFRNMHSAPYYVIVAEKTRVPTRLRDVQRQSLAHCLQNMWLMATAIGLAFQPISMTASFNRNRRWCALLGLQPGESELDGCLIGYPQSEAVHAPKVFNPEQSIQWME